MTRVNGTGERPPGAFTVEIAATIPAPHTGTPRLV